jgi:hypothetical protein
MKEGMEFDEVLDWLGEPENNFGYDFLEKILDSKQYTKSEKRDLFLAWMEKDENNITLDELEEKVLKAISGKYITNAAQCWLDKNISNIGFTELKEKVLPFFFDFNQKVALLAWIFNNPTDIEGVKEANELLEELKERRNLTLEEVALILSEKHSRHDNFYAPALKLDELNGFLEIFINKHINIYPNQAIEQSFVIGLESDENHWGAGVIKVDTNNNINIFIFEPLAQLSAQDNKTYIRNILREFNKAFDKDTLDNNIIFETNRDKLQGSDYINCAVFSIQFVFNLINQEKLRGADLFAYSANAKNKKKCTVIDISPTTKKREIPVNEVSLEPRLIRSMQSFFRIDERMKSEPQASKNPVNKKGDYMKEHDRPHGVTQKTRNDSTGVLEEVTQNKRIQYKRKNALERINGATKNLSEKEKAAMAKKSTLAGYKDYVDGLVSAKGKFDNVAEAIFLITQEDSKTNANKPKITFEQISHSLMKNFSNNPEKMAESLNIKDTEILQSNSKIKNLAEKLTSATPDTVQGIIKNTMNYSKGADSSAERAL